MVESDKHEIAKYRLSLSINSAIKSTPKISLEIMLDILSLDIYIKIIAHRVYISIRYYLVRDGQGSVHGIDYLSPNYNLL